MELIIHEPVQDCRVKVGEFTWDGLEEKAEFFVICEKAEDAEGISRNIEALNQQVLDMWDVLEEEGRKNIKYNEICPCPLDYAYDGGENWKLL